MHETSTDEPSADNVVRFPADRRRRMTVEDVEAMLRERWQDVVNEPIPGRWLQLLSLIERIEAERALARDAAPVAPTRPAPAAPPAAERPPA